MKLGQEWTLIWDHTLLAVSNGEIDFNSNRLSGPVPRQSGIVGGAWPWYSKVPSGVWLQQVLHCYTGMLYFPEFFCTGLLDSEEITISPVIRTQCIKFYFSKLFLLINFNLCYGCFSYVYILVPMQVKYWKDHLELEVQTVISHHLGSGKSFARAANTLNHHQDFFPAVILFYILFVLMCVYVYIYMQIPTKTKRGHWIP